MHYHFIGIKGSGMASLATIVADRGDEVSGSAVSYTHLIYSAPLQKNIANGMLQVKDDHVRCV